MNSKTVNKEPMTAVRFLEDQILKIPDFGGYVKIHMVDLVEMINEALLLEEDQMTESYHSGFNDALKNGKANTSLTETH